VAVRFRQEATGRRPGAALVGPVRGLLVRDRRPSLRNGFMPASSGSVEHDVVLMTSAVRTGCGDEVGFRRWSAATVVAADEPSWC